jgi:hypothetical protein
MDVTQSTLASSDTVANAQDLPTNHEPRGFFADQFEVHELIPEPYTDLIPFRTRVILRHISMELGQRYGGKLEGK